ncbi:hydro-lyase, Fe-S type, tartrate/fumarate subfamily, beta subunit [Ruminiclostridium papyrosolvens DSM 2782]|uniref:Hydro-lyase, Fe-S type, tartrate/fumarate subfamily, beta subunit n=1 Tax=Ruminiclostridium papyrosolvens DSM 2782 TaxID=588581 RepID=F1T8U1_9FIRM|nr:FumA C-terminus/TtdB family hydratase beta subunit [Ruminiclostridium papyrosolvens]EGD48923.1 hydro-lyase, Fe-S type, tartrate/fumarate subfamily, beta subunit [Ruminiclostridium papyrosolvens DSM 2782]WES35407.1 FumA C-terminus/TtdB family hydratase beta subunit [Ruminiclostridium papyrosolvens DSM 2782]
MKTYYLKTPLKDEDIAKLEAGDTVYLSGKLYTARDMAHYKLKKLLDSNGKFDEDLNGQAIFHAGPIISVNRESGEYKVISIGPTSSIRMDPYTDMVGEMGVKILIGKGGMSDSTTEAMKKHTMVYLLAAHGCAAVHTQRVTKVTHQYWMDKIGMPEAMWVMECDNLGPLIVGIDSKGRNLFEETRKNSKDMIEAISKQTHCKSK